jgi:hypothetical protein
MFLCTMTETRLDYGPGGHLPRADEHASVRV